MAAKKPAPKKAGKPKTTPKPMLMDQKWQSEDDARTLMRAEEIKADKARLNKAQRIAKSQAEAAMKVCKQ